MHKSFSSPIGIVEALMLSKSESHTPKVAASVGTLQLLRRGVQRKGLGFDMHPHASSGVTDQAHVDRVLGL